MRPSTARPAPDAHLHATRGQCADVSRTATRLLHVSDGGFAEDGARRGEGCADERIVIAGRGCAPQEIEAVVEASHPALRPGTATAYTVPMRAHEALVVACEMQRATPRSLRAADVTRAVRAALATELGLQVEQVVLLRTFATRCAQGGTARRRWCRTHHLCRTIAASAWSDGRDRTRERCDDRPPVDGAPQMPRIRRIERAD